MVTLKLLSKNLIIAFLLLLALWLLSSCSGELVVHCANYEPPDRGMPGRLEGGGTRYSPSDCDNLTIIRG